MVTLQNKTFISQEKMVSLLEKKGHGLSALPEIEASQSAMVALQKRVVLLLERNGQYIENMTRAVSSVLQNQTQEIKTISSTLSTMAALLGVVNLLQHDNPMDDTIGTTTDAVPTVLAEETPTNIDTAVPTIGQMNAVPTVPTGKSSTYTDTAVPIPGQMDAVTTVPTGKTPTNIDTAVPTTAQINAVPTVSTGKPPT